MKWLLIGGLGLAALLAMRSRAEYPEPPEAYPAPPLPSDDDDVIDITEDKQVTVTTPEGDTWEATLEGSYYQVVD